MYYINYFSTYKLLTDSFSCVPGETAGPEPALPPTAQVCWPERGGSIPCPRRTAAGYGEDTLNTHTSKHTCTHLHTLHGIFICLMFYVIRFISLLQLYDELEVVPLNVFTLRMNRPSGAGDFGKSTIGTH